MNTSPKPDPILEGFSAWAREEGESQTVRATPAMLRLKAELAREEAGRERVRRLERGVLAGTVLTAAMLAWRAPFQVALGLGTALPLVAAAAVLGFSFAWLLES